MLLQLSRGRDVGQWTRTLDLEGIEHVASLVDLAALLQLTPNLRWLAAGGRLWPHFVLTICRATVDTLRVLKVTLVTEEKQHAISLGLIGNLVALEELSICVPGSPGLVHTPAITTVQPYDMSQLRSLTWIALGAVVTDFVDLLVRSRFRALRTLEVGLPSVTSDEPVTVLNQFLSRHRTIEKISWDLRWLPLMQAIAMPTSATCLGFPRVSYSALIPCLARLSPFVHTIDIPEPPNHAEAAQIFNAISALPATSSLRRVCILLGVPLKIRQESFAQSPYSMLHAVTYGTLLYYSTVLSARGIALVDAEGFAVDVASTGC
jgi:hypothetical protein